jgi:hypothetical protein
MHWLEVFAAASPILKGTGAILNAPGSGECKHVIFTLVKIPGHIFDH